MEDSRSTWVKLVADGYSADLPVQDVLAATPQGSYLSTRVEFELKHSLANPIVRLNCSAVEAEELVAAIRQGSNYEPPADNPRLLNSLKRTFAFHGLSTSSFPASSATQEVLVVPTYYIGAEFFMAPWEELGEGADESHGVLLYSSSAQGWANRIREQDPRPDAMKASMKEGRMGYTWLAAVLRSESTGAGEDLCYMLPNECGAGQFPAPDYTPALLHSNLELSTFATPPLHRNTGGAAMTAADGKLYLLGGVERSWPENHLDGYEGVVPHPGTLQVYNPQLDTWFAATPPVPGCSLEGHVLVANKKHGMLVALGGTATPERRGEANIPQNWAKLGMYDIRSAKWTLNPSRCTWPVPSGMRHSQPLAAAAVADQDHDAIVIIREGDHRGTVAAGVDAATVDRAAIAGKECPVDVLDLRMWRFRSVEPLQRHYTCGVSLVDYDGRLVAIGGAGHPNVSSQYGECSSKCVSAFDHRTGTWSEMPDLPFTLSHASAVVMRMPSVLPAR